MRDRKIHIIYFTQTAAIGRILEEIEIIEYLFCTTSMEFGLQLKEIQKNSQIIDQKIYI
jgi:hypothetical protein